MSSQNNSLPTVDDELEKANKIKAIKRKIEELETRLTHLEYEAGANKFKNVEHLIANNKEKKLPKHPASKRIVDVEAQFCNDLFRFGGFTCTRATEEEFIFNLSSGSKYRVEHAYMVEILIKNGNLSVGRWIMPPSIYKDILESEVKMKSTKDIPLFLSNCRQYITCFVSRVEQYEALQEIASQKKNCSVQSTSAFTEIVIDFLNVHKIEQDVNVNLRVNMFYNAKEVRPHTILVKNLGSEGLSREELKVVKNSLKAFKMEDLNTAFEKVLTEESGPFVWPPSRDETIIHNLNEWEDPDDFEDRTIDSLASPRKRRRGSDSDGSDDPDYDGKSANYSRSKKKSQQSARAKKVDDANLSNKQSQKGKPARPVGIKKTNTAKKSKKKI